MNPRDPLIASAIALVIALLPIYIGLLLPQALATRSGGWRRLLPGFAAGILFASFFDLTKETAGLGTATLRSFTDFFNVLTFSLALLFFLALHLHTEISKGSVATLLLTYLWSIIGVGFHSVGEGVVIGYDLSTGATVFSISQGLSFALHKVGEGFTIGILLSWAGPQFTHALLLGLLAGLPAALGTLSGLGGVPAVTSTYFFAASVGATLYLLARLIPMTNGAGRTSVATIFLGFLYMYLSGILHQFE